MFFWEGMEKIVLLTLVSGLRLLNILPLGLFDVIVAY